MSGVKDLVQLLRTRAAERPHALGYLIADEDDIQRMVTYRDLDQAALRVARMLREEGLRTGDRAMLLHPPGYDYVAGFFGCLYAGVIAVPAYPPAGKRTMRQVEAIAADAGAKIALGTTTGSNSLRWTDLAGEPSSDWDPDLVGADAVAFLQYTSGSTAEPKGVVVSHGNLVHNSAAIARLLRHGQDTRAVSWLPPYHDMGLIGAILQPLYGGFPALLMPPRTFLYHPYRWLKAITDFAATASAAPDFAYRECVRRVTDEELQTLDLSTWRHAMTGAEPVRAATMAQFARRFKPAGFRPGAFRPCYGLAEATLFVTAVPPGRQARTLHADRESLAAGVVAEVPDGMPLVGCGSVAGGEDAVAVIDAETLTECAPGRIGEIWVSGPTVAQGYWNMPSEAFTARRTDAAGTWLRTGDLGFMRDGDLFVTGRLKDLVVIRGANHYPADIEVTAEQAVQSTAAAFSVDDGSGENLVLVMELGRGIKPSEPITDSIRAAIARDHHLDVAEIVYVRPGGIPRTTSGKIRRIACRDAYLAGTLNTLTAAVQTAEPVAVTAELALVANALDIPPARLRLDIPLASQGIDSLRAARLRHELRISSGLDVDIAELLGDTPIGELMSTLRPSGTTPIPTAQSNVASSAMHRLWLLDQLGMGRAHHLAGHATLPGLSVDWLQDALRALAERHDALRTGLRHGPTGPELVQLPGIPRIESYRPDFADRPFDLAKPPLWRVAVQGETVFLCIHHLIADGRSLATIMGDLESLYIGHELPPLPVRYVDYVAWQRNKTTSTTYWRDRLAGVAPTAIPGDTVEGGGVIPLELPADLVTRLRAVTDQRRTTLYMIVAAAWAVILHRWSGQKDVVVGVAADVRDHPDLADVVGFLVNMLPLRVTLDPTGEVRDLLAHIREVALAAYRHRDVPFEEIVRQAGSSGEDLVRNLLVLREELPARRFRDVERVYPAAAAKFDLEIDLSPHDGGLRGTMVFAARYSEPFARQIADAFTLVLTGLCAGPDTPVWTLPVLTPEALSRIDERGGGTEPHDGPDLLAWFAATAERRADAIAVLDDRTSSSLTFREFDTRTNQLSHWLRTQGVGPEVGVGVFLERGLDLLVAVWAVLKAGGVYIPLDTDYPPGRTANMIADARPALVLTTSALADRFDGPVACVDRQPQAAMPETPVDVDVLPDNAAYVIFTSGSTGRPKGAVVTHGAVVNRIHAVQRLLPLDESDVAVHKVPIGFDVSVSELLWPLLAGTRVVIAAPGGHRDPAYLHRLFRDHGVTIVDFVPSMLRAYLDSGHSLTKLRAVISLGEELTADLARDFTRRFPGVGLYNRYGPAEATIDVTQYLVRGHEQDRVPMGVPFQGVRLLVLDSHGQPVAAGVAGELYIAGVQNARGYVHRPAITAQVFLPHDNGTRVYKTGDRVCWTPDGRLVYLSRVDHQIKIRGQRVEPGEIEATFRTHPDIANAAVVVRPGPELAAYVVPEVDTAQLRQFLSEHLPAHMVPATITCLDKLPLSPNGKLDRPALPAPTAPRAEYVAPRDPIESGIATIWAEALELPRVGMHDGFFALGGHSLLATQITARIRTELGVNLPVADLLSQHCTVAMLAEQVRETRLRTATPDELTAALDTLAALSDEEVAARLTDGM